MYEEKNCIIDKHKIAHINRPKFNLSNKEKNIAMVIKSRAIGIIFINNKMQSKIDNTALLINRVNAYENKNCTNNRKIQTITLDNKIDTNEMGLFSIKSFLPKV